MKPQHKIIISVLTLPDKTTVEVLHQVLARAAAKVSKLC